VANSPLETTIFGLEPLDFNYFSKEWMQKIKSHPSKHAWMLGLMYDQLWSSHVTFYDDLEKFPPVAYDPGVIPSLIKKDYCKIQPCEMEILLDGPKRGKTTFTFVKNSQSKCLVATWVDQQMFQKML